MSPEIFFAVHGALPAAVVTLLAVIPALLMRRMTLTVRRPIPAFFAAAGYLAAYLMLNGVPHGAAESWHRLLPAAVIAGVLAVAVETLPRWYFRLGLFLAAAAALAYFAAPPAEKTAPYSWQYVGATLAAEVIFYLALRAPAEKTLPGVGLLILCLTVFAAGYIDAQYADNAKQGTMLMAAAVPPGVLAALSVIKPLRDVTLAGLTAGSLIAPVILTMAYFYNSTDDGSQPKLALGVFPALVAVPLAGLIAVIPVRGRWKWVTGGVAVVIAAVALAGIAQYAAHHVPPPPQWE